MLQRFVLSPQHVVVDGNVSDPGERRLSHEMQALLARLPIFVRRIAVRMQADLTGLWRIGGKHLCDEFAVVERR